MPSLHSPSLENLEVEVSPLAVRFWAGRRLATTTGGSMRRMFVLAVLFCSLAALSSEANAQSSPPAGGCLSPTLCVGPSASLTVAAFNLTTSQFSGGVSPGIGYGLTYTPPTAAWAAVGVDVYASLRLGQGQPNQANFALMLHGLNVYVGIGPSIVQGPPTIVQWSIFAGPGVSVQSAGKVYEQAAAKAGQ